MVLKAAVQALKKADVLKAQAAQANAALQNDKGNCVNILLNDSATWSARQQLTNALHQVLVLDLDYALDQKVEQELWTHGFKNYIATLQSLSRDKKNPKRSELQALLAWCLESATGFYLTLFQELCEAFQLDLPFRRRGIAYGSIVGRSVEQPVVTPQRSSCLYICQYCLVHLGDIARYRNQRKQAESFYKQAILLSPSSGQPYNQLALLQASRGDRLSTVFYYVRSVTLTYPFPPASTNLSKTLEMATNDVSHSESRTKMSVSEYISVFLKLHGLLQIGCDLNKTEIMVKNLTSALTALAATESFSSHRLIQMLAINLYALREAVENFTEDQLTKDETRIKNFVLDLMAGFLNAFLLPVYTLQSSNLLEYHSLPAIKLILEWIKLEPKYLENAVFTSRLQIWPSLCLLLNSIQKFIKDFEEKKYTMIPLPEDRDLQAFLPLDKAFQKLDFNTEEYKQDIIFLNKLRSVRLVQLGNWLATCQVNGNYLITAKISEDKSEYIFEPVSKQESNVSDLLKELEQMKIDSENTDVSSGSKENSQDDDIPTISQITVVDQPSIKVHQRLRTGILKPQGSLERAREEREQALLLNAGSSENSLFSNSSNSDTSNTISTTSVQSRVVDVPVNNSGAMKSGKKTRQNVAMQAILKKVEENSKQVKFQTDDDSETTEKMLKETSENTTKEEGTSKKGILSLKNQSGYPHLSENNDVPVTDNYSPSAINQRKLLNNDSKMSTIHLNPETNIQSLSFPSVIYDPQFSSTNNPNSNHNFSTASFISPNLSSNNPYRNMPEFISQSPSNIVKNNDLSPLQHYYMKSQNLQSQKFPVSNAGQGFDYCPPQNQMSNFPPHPQLNNLSFETTNPTFNNPNVMYPSSSNNNPSSSFQQFNNKFQTPLTSNPPNPYNNKLVLGPDFNLDNDNLRNSDNKIQQMPYNSAQNNYVMKNNNLWGTNQIDNKLPMPPNGWWPNSANNHDTNRFVTNTYEHYRDLNVSTQQSSFLGENYGTKSDINLSKTNDVISRQNMSWNNTLPPAPNINLPPSYHQIMLPNQNKIQPLNNDQGLTMRQKILKENRKLYSRKVMDSINEPFESTPNPNQSVSPPGYSLFNSNWAPNFSSGSSINASPIINQQNDQNGPLLGQQSLFSGPGPSPLERLLEQQKQLRGVPPK